MSYNFSFDRKSAVLLCGCTIALAALLVSAGFLLGVKYGQGPPPAVAFPAQPAPSVSAPAALPSPPPAPTVSAPALLPPLPPAAPVKASEDQSPEPAAPAPVHDRTPQADAPDPAAKPHYMLQLGAYQSRAEALAKQKELKEQVPGTTIFAGHDSAGETWYAVRSGDYDDLISASKAARDLRGKTAEVVLVRPSNRL